jgi:membrane protease YdiL (CAAX protease family)
MLLMNRSRAGVLLELVIFAGVMLAFVFAVSAVAAAADHFGLIRSPQLTNLATALATGACGVGSVLVIVWATGSRVPEIGLTRRALGLNLLIGLGTLPVPFLAFYAGAGILWLIHPPWIEMMQSNASRITEMLPKLGPAAFLATSLWVGVWEEVVFRGFVMTRVRRVVGSWWPAIAITSLVFAVPHALGQVWVTVLPLFLMAAAFSVVTIWRRSLIPAILAHAMFDFIQLMGSSPESAPAEGALP